MPSPRPAGTIRLRAAAIEALVVFQSAVCLSSVSKFTVTCNKPQVTSNIASRFRDTKWSDACSVTSSSTPRARDVAGPRAGVGRICRSKDAKKVMQLVVGVILTHEHARAALAVHQGMPGCKNSGSSRRR